MDTSYLALASLGKNHWLRYVLGMVLIVVFWQLLGGIPLLMMVLFLMEDGDPNTHVDLTTLQFSGVDSLWPYLGINFTLLAMLLGVFLAVRFVHKRTFTSVITTLAMISWKRILEGFTVFFMLIAGATLVEAAFKPGEYQVMFDPQQFLIFLPIALLVTPLQAAAEEILFRGYLMQGMGLWTRYTAIPVLGSSLLFMAAHLTNPEMGESMYLIPLLYLLMGLFLAFITVKSNSLELAIGAHAANNLFAVLIMNYANSALPAPSLFMANRIDPVASLISFVLVAAAFYWIVFMWRKAPQ